MSWTEEMEGERREHGPAPLTPEPAADDDRRRKWALRALEDECRTVSSSDEGIRNNNLNTAALKLGQIVAGGSLTHSEVVDALTAAAKHAGLGDHEIRATIASGMGAGAQEPRTPQEREERPQHNGAKNDIIRTDKVVKQAKLIELVTLGSLVGPAIERATLRRSGEEKPIPIPWPSYAEALGGGYWPGAHYVVSGTGVGKSQMTLQTGVGASKRGIPTVYIGLELEEMQIALRVVGEQIGIRWSKLYLGRCTDDELARAKAVAPSLEGLPFYCDFSPARGWPPSRLAGLCERVRQQHPSGPLLVVLDYLQLVGHDAGQFDRKPDTRERISGAAVAIRDVARSFGAAVVAVSSAARAHSGLLASDCREAGLVTREVPGQFAPVRTIVKPSVLLGIGKESGEIEYSADSVTTMIRWPTPLDNGETAIICATPKVRSVGERWCALAFDGGRFVELDVQSIEDLPEVAKRGKGPSVDNRELETRVLDTVRGGIYTSRTAIALATKGTKAELLKAIGRLLESSELEQSEGRFAVRGSE